MPRPGHDVACKKQRHEIGVVGLVHKHPLLSMATTSLRGAGQR